MKLNLGQYTKCYMRDSNIKWAKGNNWNTGKAEVKTDAADKETGGRARGFSWTCLITPRILLRTLNSPM